MKKKSIFLIGALVILFGCYIGLLALIAPIGPVFAITLLFSLVPMLLLAAIVMLFLPADSIEGYFFQEPSIRFGILYTVIQLIAGFILTLLLHNVKIVLIVELIILGVMGGVTAYVAYGGLHAKDVNEKHKGAISNMKRIQAEAKSILDATDDYEWKRLVKAVWEDINYASPVTTEETERVENDICFELELLRRAVAEKNREEFDASAKKIKTLLAARK